MARLNNLSRLRRDLKTVTSRTHNFGVKPPFVPFSGKSNNLGPNYSGKPDNPRLAAVASARQREFQRQTEETNRFWPTQPKSVKPTVPDEDGGRPWTSTKASKVKMATYNKLVREQNKLRNEANEAMELAAPDNVCSICNQHFDVASYSPTLSCGHKFHRGCICKWFEKKENCPICRRDILDDENRSICGNGGAAQQSPSSSF